MNAMSPQRESSPQSQKWRALAQTITPLRSYYEVLLWGPTMRFYYEVLLWGPTMRSYYEVLLWGPTMRSYYEVLLWGPTMRFYYEVLLWGPTMRSYYEVLLWGPTMRSYYEVLLWGPIMRSYYEVLLWGPTMRFYYEVLLWGPTMRSYYEVLLWGPTMRSYYEFIPVWQETIKLSWSHVFLYCHLAGSMFHPQMAEDLALTKRSLANHHDLLLPSGKRKNYWKLLYISMLYIQILSDQHCLGMNTFTCTRQFLCSWQRLTHVFQKHMHSHSKCGSSIWASLECQCCFWITGRLVSYLTMWVLTLQLFKNSIDTQGKLRLNNEPPVFECEWAFRIQA
jgi:hypothetical protein